MAKATRALKLRLIVPLQRTPPHTCWDLSPDPGTVGVSMVVALR